MATATLPVLKELLADPAKYPDSTKYRNADGSEVTLGELRKAGVNSTSVAVEAPASPNADTDKVVAERLEQKKKHKKHPVEARIGELTAKAAELEKTLKKEREEREAAIAAQNEKNIAAELDRRKAEAAANDKRPDRAAFPEGAAGDTEFTTKMAEWVVRQQDKITPKVAAPPPSTDRVATLNETQTAQAKTEYDHFLEVGTEFIKKNPDFNETLEAAAKRGLTLHNRAQWRIIKRAIPQVAYYLARPENEIEARNLMKMDEFDQELEVVRIAERLAAKPGDFVSSAPPPGRRLNGSTVTDVTDPSQMTPDEYLRWRREQFKSGARRPPHR